MADLRVSVELAGRDAGATQIIKSVGSALGSLTGAIKAPTSAIGGLISSFSGLGMGVFGLTSLASGVGSLASGMVSGNTQMETYTTQLGTLMGSADKAKTRLAELAKFGAETPFELPEIVRAEKVLLGFGLTGQKVFDLTGKTGEQFRSLVGDIAAGTGAQFEEIALNMGKFSSGATGEAIARFQEMGIATREQMKELGVQFSKSGELLSPLPVAMEAITKIAQSKFGGGMKQLSQTASGQLSTLMDNFGQIKNQLAAPIFDVFKNALAGANDLIGTAGFQAHLKTVADLLAGGVQRGLTVGTQLFKGLMTTIQNVGPTIVEIATRLQTFFGSLTQGETLATAVNKAFGDIIPPGLNTVLDVIDSAFSTVKSTVGGLIATVQEGGLAGLWRDVQAAMSDFGPTGERIGSVIRDVVAAISSLIPQPIKNLVSELFNTARGAGEGVDILGTLADVVNRVSGVMADMVGFVKENTAAQAALVGILGAVAAGFAISGAIQAYNTALGVAAAAGKAFAAVQGLINVVLTANPIGIVVIALAGLAAALVYAYQNSEEFRDIVDKAFASVKGIVQSAIPVVTAAFNTMVAVVKVAIEVFNQIRETVSTAMKNIVETVSSSWTRVSTFISSSMDTIRRIIESSWETVRSVVEDKIGNVLTTVQTQFGKLVGVIEAVGRDTFTAALNLGISVINGIRQGIEQAWGNLVGFFNSKLRNLLPEGMQAIGAHSPARLFMPMGEAVAQGIASGMGTGLETEVSDVIKSWVLWAAGEFDALKGGGLARVMEDVFNLPEQFGPSDPAALALIGNMNTRLQKYQADVQALVQATATGIAAMQGELAANLAKAASDANAAITKLDRDIAQKSADMVKSLNLQRAIEAQRDAFRQMQAVANEAFKVRQTALQNQLKQEEQVWAVHFKTNLDLQRIGQTGPTNPALAAAQKNLDTQTELARIAFRERDEIAKFAFRSQDEMAKLSLKEQQELSSAWSIDHAAAIKAQYAEEKAALQAKLAEEKTALETSIADERTAIQTRLDEEKFINEAVAAARAEVAKEQLEQRRLEILASRDQQLQAIKDAQAQELYIAQQTAGLRTTILQNEQAHQAEQARQQAQFQRDLENQALQRSLDNLAMERLARTREIELALRDKRALLIADAQEEQRIFIAGLQQRVEALRRTLLSDIPAIFKMSGIDIGELISSTVERIGWVFDPNSPQFNAMINQRIADAIAALNRNTQVAQPYRYADLSRSAQTVGATYVTNNNLTVNGNPQVNTYEDYLAWRERMRMVT